MVGMVGKLLVLRRCPMHKKDVVRLSAEARSGCQGLIQTLQGASPTFRRAPILRKADAEGAGWSEVKMAEAFDGRVHTIETRRTRLVPASFARALDGKQRQEPPTPCKLDGQAEAPRIAL